MSFQFPLDPEIFQKLERRAAREGIAVGSLVNALLEHSLAGESVGGTDPQALPGCGDRWRPFGEGEGGEKAFSRRSLRAGQPVIVLIASASPALVAGRVVRDWQNNSADEPADVAVDIGGTASLHRRFHVFVNVDELHPPPLPPDRRRAIA